MTQHIEAEAQRLREIAQEYQRRGYKVIVYPRDGDIPKFLHGQQLDLIAKGKGENIVVEVARSGDNASAAKSGALAQAISARKNWRFELVVVPNPAYDPIENPRNYTRPLNSQETSTILTQAIELLERGNREAAFLLAWSAVEAILRELMEREGLVIKRGVPGEMLKSLYAHGVINKRDYDLLAARMKLRNALSHGYRAPLSKADLSGLLSAARRIASRAKAA
jgi:hypothetical protein